MEIRRTINMRDEDPAEGFPPYEVTVIVDMDTFTITDMNGAWIFRAPIEVLVLQLCTMTPELAQYVIPHREPPRCESHRMVEPHRCHARFK